MKAEKMRIRVRMERASEERSASGSRALGSPAPDVRVQRRLLDRRLGLGAGLLEAVTKRMKQQGCGGQKSGRCGHGRAPSDGPGGPSSPLPGPGGSWGPCAPRLSAAPSASVSGHSGLSLGDWWWCPRGASSLWAPGIRFRVRLIHCDLTLTYLQIRSRPRAPPRRGTSASLLCRETPPNPQQLTLSTFDKALQHGV